MTREDQDRFGFQVVGQDDSALDQLLAALDELGVFKIIRPAAALDAPGDAVEDFDALEWIFANGRLAAEHDGVGLLKNGVGHVGDFGAGRHRRFNHAFEHVRGDNHGPAQAETGFYNPPLDNRQLLVRDFDAEITARDHDRIGLADDPFEVAERFLVLDFGQDQRRAFRVEEKRAQLDQGAGFSDKRERDEIHAQFQAQCDVGDVLGGEGGQADFDAGQVDVAAAAELAFGQDLALDLVAVLGEDFHLERAVVNEHNVADADVVDEILVVHVHGAFLLAAFAAHGERELLSGPHFQGQRPLAGADGRALGVHQNADKSLAGLGGGTDVTHDASDPIVLRVRHVEPEDVDAGVYEPAEHFRRVGGGAEGGDDFGFARGAGVHGRSIAGRGWGERFLFVFRAFDRAAGEEALARCRRRHKESLINLLGGTDRKST